MKDLLMNPTIHQKKKHNLLPHLNHYNVLETDSERLKYLETTSLGLMGFSRGAFNDAQSFEEILDCYVRGESKIRGQMIQIKVGEIKSAEKL